MLICGHDRGGVFADRDAAGLAEIPQCDLVEGHGPILTDQRGSSQDGDVRQSRFAPFSKGGCPNRRHLNHAPVLVHDKRCEGFTVHFFRENEQRSSAFLNGL